MVAVVCVLSGCSLIYNPSNLPSPDAKDFQDMHADSPLADADPSMLALSDLQPATIYEGQGVGNSRPAVLTIRGNNFVPGATVMITPTSGSADLTLGDVVVAADGNSLAVPVTANLMDGSASTVPLMITVAEDGVSQNIGWSENTLVELKTASQLTTGVMARYSMVNLTTPLIFGSGSGSGSGSAVIAATAPVIIHSMSTLTVGAIFASASATVPGPGGALAEVPAAQAAQAGWRRARPARWAARATVSIRAARGGSGAAGSAGGDGGGAGSLAMGGGGNGGTKGDPFVTSYSAEQPGGGGGGGGGGGKALGAAGGAGGTGGVGGGIIELHADGDLTATSITAHGGAGTAGGTTGGGGGGGGGGAGGIAIIRAGHAILGTPPTFDLAGGAAGGTGNGGSTGRARCDVPSGTVANAQVGPAFAPTNPLITRDHTVTLAVRLPTGITFALTQLDQDGTLAPATTAASGSVDGTANVQVLLTNGWNHICLTVPGGIYTDDVANECIDVAFMSQ